MFLMFVTCLGVAHRAKWAVKHSHLKWNMSISLASCWHRDLKLVSRSPVSRIHGIERRERISEPVCARIQNCRILEKSDRDQSEIARTTLGGHILQNSAEPTGQIHLCVVGLWSRCDVWASCWWPCLRWPLRMCSMRVHLQSQSMSLL